MATSTVVVGFLVFAAVVTVWCGMWAAWAAVVGVRRGQPAGRSALYGAVAGPFGVAAVGVANRRPASIHPVASAPGFLLSGPESASRLPWARRLGVAAVLAMVVALVSVAFPWVSAFPRSGPEVRVSRDVPVQADLVALPEGDGFVRRLSIEGASIPLLGLPVTVVAALVLIVIAGGVWSSRTWALLAGSFWAATVSTAAGVLLFFVEWLNLRAIPGVALLPSALQDLVPNPSAGRGLWLYLATASIASLSCGGAAVAWEVALERDRQEHRDAVARGRHLRA